jgi:hypothetical protein
MPNMSWIFNRAGVAIYKSDWSDANRISNALDYHLDVLERRRGKERLVPFHVERLDYRTSDQQGFAAFALDVARFEYCACQCGKAFVKQRALRRAGFFPDSQNQTVCFFIQCFAAVNLVFHKVFLDSKNDVNLPCY